MSLKEVKISDGITLYYMNPEDKFKTNYISVNLISKLKRETVTKNALIPLVLRRGTKSLKTMKEISTKLEDMYGAILNGDTDKLGDNLVTSFNLDMISNKYTLDGEDLFSDATNLLCEMLINPYTEDGAFKEEYVLQEKTTLKELIESKINDKGTYSIERAVEEMYKDEPYGVYKYGYTEDLGEIDAKCLYKEYLTLMATATINIYFIGDIDEEKVVNLFKNEFSKIERKFVKEENNNCSLEKTFNEVIEHQNVMQGKLVLGYYLKDYKPEEDFYNMTMYTAILGGTASSKLFMNVREKKSLAYTIRATFVKHKGAMFASAGIELPNYEFAKECIIKEIKDMEIGEITDGEIKDAKLNLITRFKALNDYQSALAGWAIGQTLLDGEQNLDVVIEKINAVTKEDIVKVANRLKLSMSYYLCL